MLTPYDVGFDHIDPEDLCLITGTIVDQDADTSSNSLARQKRWTRQRPGRTRFKRGESGGSRTVHRKVKRDVVEEGPSSSDQCSVLYIGKTLVYSVYNTKT